MNEQEKLWVVDFKKDFTESREVLTEEQGRQQIENGYKWLDVKCLGDDGKTHQFRARKGIEIQSNKIDFVIVSCPICGVTEKLLSEHFLTN